MKHWSTEIEHHIQQWTEWCKDRGYKWAPRLAYHFTDVHNAAAILNSGTLLSRASATQMKCMVNDNASPHIIANTPEHHTRFARLYFRPRTPTQYHNEGISPAASRRRGYGAHCPVPIFLCFDLQRLLQCDDVEFSNGSMGRPEVEHGSSLELFRKIPFDKVYHDGPLPSTDKPTHIFHRHAEVLVPTQLTLVHLVGVACRSPAERTTLLHILDSHARARWTPHTRCVGDALYYRHKCFIESASVVDRNLHLRFHNHAILGRSFIGVHGVEQSSRRSWEWRGALPGADLAIEVPSSEPTEVCVEIEGSIAYRAILDFGDDIPF